MLRIVGGLFHPCILFYSVDHTVIHNEAPSKDYGQGSEVSFDINPRLLCACTARVSKQRGKRTIGVNAWDQAAVETHRKQRNPWFEGQSLSHITPSALDL